MQTRLQQDRKKRKRMRKGTHSCLECRRRKVQCRFSSPNESVCITCHRRGAQCISQLEHFEEHTSEHCSQRPHADVERLHESNFDIANVMRNNDAIDASRKNISFPPTPASIQQGSPLGSLANHRYEEETNSSRNQFISVDSPRMPPLDQVATIEPDVHSAITLELLRSVPPRQDLEILIEIINATPRPCYQAKFKIRGSIPPEIPQETFSASDLLNANAHPVLLARQMLLLAVALQCLPAKKPIASLSKHHRIIMEELAESASKLVTMNDALLGWLEGLENIMLEAIYHTDGGNIRRAWITMRRAVAAAQLLGLHRARHYRFKVLRNKSDLDPEAMWAGIVFAERITSLLLGLPTSIVGAAATIQEAVSPMTQNNDLSGLISSIMAKVIERNEISVYTQG